MHLFDCSSCYGRYRTPVYRFARTAQDLLAEMDFVGVERALVYHTAMRFVDAATGNRLLVQDLAGEPRLAPSWALLPTQTGEQSSPEAFLADMRKHNVRALRLFPQDHRFTLDDITLGDQLEVYQERRIPLFIRSSPDRIGRLLKSFPLLVAILGTPAGDPLDRYILPLVDRFPNVYVETSGYLVDNILAWFCRRFTARRLLFASGYPDHCNGAAKLMLKHAEISEEERAAIGSGNLERLLSEVQL